MVWGSYCGFCIQAKPEFKTLAKTHGSNEVGNGVIFANIQVDGSESEKSLGSQLGKITGKSLSGVPAYLLFENGKFSAMLSGGRQAAELTEFMS
jgi:thiol-disulfide isomerase/thioredoxin